MSQESITTNAGSNVDLEKIVAARITKLQSGSRAERKEAAALGNLLGAYRRGTIGDNILQIASGQMAALSSDEFCNLVLGN